jgi:DNA-binding winged helix-turn-helix (wHTH) protein/tetratricopeptide (TPR) repeat protein
MPLVEKEIYRFDRFVLDPVERILLCEGTPVSLTPKAFDTLVCLVRNQGSMVTKDELLRRIWPDTFVEEINLAVNISTLRKALGESPQESRFIATVPGRGYRFVAQVATGDAAPALPKETDPKPRTRFSRKILLAWAFALSLAVIGSAFLISRFSHWSAPLTERDTIVLADFTNKTGEVIFDDTLRQGLSSQLEQSPFLNLLSDQRIAQTLSLMAKPKHTPLTAELAREICERTASAATIEGSISSLGTQYVLGLQALNCRNGDLVADEQVTANDKEQVLKALGDAATKLRRALGESLASVHQYGVPLEQVTTPSLEALKAYSLGHKVFDEQGAGPDIPYHKRAVEIDPNFAAAYAVLGVEYASLGETRLAREYMTKAYQLRERTSEREKFAITSFYHSFVTGDLEHAKEVDELWNQSYLRDEASYGNLGYDYAVVGQYEKAAVLIREALNLNPNNATGYGNLAVIYLFLGRFAEAKAVTAQAFGHKLDGPDQRQVLYALALLGQDGKALDEQAAWGKGQPGNEDLMLSLEADTEALSGHLDRAREFSQRATETAKRDHLPEQAADWQAEAALREAFAGNTASAKKAAQAALAISSGRDTKSMVALAVAGDKAGAGKLAGELENEYPSDTLVNGYWLPAIRATVALKEKKPADAIEALRAAEPNELGQVFAYVDYACLYPAYLRGQAYLAQGQGRAAQTEFQKYLDHRGLVWNCPLASLAHLGLARAYTLQGDTGKARAAYNEFLTLWKNADPDIPILKQAKAEYAKVQ